jgi:hypothetical protein
MSHNNKPDDTLEDERTTLPASGLLEAGKPRPAKRITFGVIVICAVALIVGLSTCPREDSVRTTAPGGQNATQSAQSATPLTPKYEAGTRERLGYEIRLAMSTSDRGMVRVPVVLTSGREIQVTVALNDMPSLESFKSAMEVDVGDILKAIHDSGYYSYDEIKISGTFGISDVYGRATETEILRVSYTRMTIDTIDWKGFLYSNVYRVATSVWIRPGFQ